MKCLRAPTLCSGMSMVCAIALLISCQRGDTTNSTASALVTAHRAGSQSPRVFKSPLAGQWYPATKEAVASEIDEYLSQVSDRPFADTCALILPHAGYRWSGPTAAYGVHQLQNRSFARVVVLGPSHHVAMENVASVPDVTHYETPLGQVPLDRMFIAELRKHAEFQCIPRAHEQEHSVQIQLPLLQQVLHEFQFVPIVVGRLDRPTMQRIGRILSGLVDPETLVVASSDFTHYGANFGYVPFRSDVPDQLKKLDDGAIEQVCKKNLDGLFDYIDQTGATICGRCAIGVLLSMLPDDAVVHKLHYDTSGKMLDDYSSSVSYCAFSVSGKWPKVDRVEPPLITNADKQRLLHLARATLTYVLAKEKIPTVEQLGIELTPAMTEVRGAFVTLQKNGQLRGCVGEITPTRALYKAVMAEAVNAGLRDYRFQPVKSSELNEIEFEISVLTPASQVASASDIVLGTHGIILKKGRRSAVYLPQVAPEQGWDLETTLTHLSQKAGLPGDAWKEGASFEIFEAIVFGEHKETAEAAGR